MMSLSSLLPLVLYCLSANAQQKGTNQAENHPPLTTYQCAAGGTCTPETSYITLDANWRWTHKVGTSTNCYTGDEWDTGICPDPVTCASNCAIDGADYPGTYGIFSNGDSMSITLVTKGQYDTNIGARTYVMDSDTTYKMYKLKNREFAFDVDVSSLACGINGALYFVSMDADGGLSKYPGNRAGAAYGTGYCDAQCPDDDKFINGEANILGWAPDPNGDPNSGEGKYGTCCTEMDIWEANQWSTAVTPHMCTVDGQYRCNGTECGEGGDRFNGVCDKNGCDINPYRGGNVNFYGPGGGPSPPPPSGSCTFTPNSNNLGTILGTPTVQTDPVGCCAVCTATPQCVGFTYVEASSNCFLKSSLGTPVADPGATSGSKGSKAPSTSSSLLPALLMGLGGFTLDTTKPLTVVTQFITSDGSDSGDLVEIKRSFIQGGVHIPHPPATNIPGGNFSSVTDAYCKAKGVAYTNENDNFETFGGLKRMGEDMDRGMVLVLSQWVDYEAHMLWLDSTYPTNSTPSDVGAMRGSCDISSGNPPDVIANTPGAKVTFSKVSLGPIGWSQARLGRTGSATFTIPWEFSWDTLSTFAFPGDAPRFMSPSEASHFSNFSMMLIWGMNATCYNATTGEYFEPSCYSSVMYCDKAHPETQPFVRNMETSLQEQGRRLKASRPTYFPVLGYIEGMSIQQTYAKQMALVDNNSSALLSIASKGLVDCFTWGGCNWQGVEYRQYDLRQAAVVEYYAQEVIGTLINNPGLDGSFVDVVDYWESECGRWGCTAQEAADLTQASLTAVDAALGYAASLGKVLSISSHTSLASYPTYYHAQLELLIKHGNGFRFWEFFTNTEDDVNSLAYETQTKGVPTHVHVTKRTLNPDWVELACFLLAMGEHSYFSFSGPWMLDSFDIFPEYSQPLGRPLGPPLNTSTPTLTLPWQLLPGQNLVYGWPSAPNASASIPGKLAFLGVQPNASACLALAQSNASFTAMTWVGATQDEWALSCWARLDREDWGACIGGQVGSPPCYAQMQGGGDHVSAVSAPFAQNLTVWRRSFEYVNVSWWSGNNSAVMEGWAN